ncbi:MAG: DUF1080 domain-containing protein [Lentisphaerales bacterium]|nr:DUF1080 domain-containing protein [Lentisphaerales bacterium]
MLVGERNYSSSQSMPSLAVHLEEELGLKVTYLTIPKNGSIKNIDEITSADLLIFYLQERNIPDTQFQKICKMLDSGTSAIAFKTSSLAFSHRPQWFSKYFGGAFQGFAERQGTSICALPENDHHPIIADLEIKSFKSSDSLIFPGPLANDTNVLLMGKSRQSHAVPVAWTRERANGQRLFYTSLGNAEEFESDHFINIIDKTVHWCLDKTIKTPSPKEPTNVPDTPPLVLPVGAKVIFNGENFDNWQHWDIRQSPRSIGSSENHLPYFQQIKSKTPRWRIENEALIPVIGQEDIMTNNSYKNYHLHIEFYVPKEPDYVPSDFRGAGGIFISGRYEIQILAKSQTKRNTSGGSIFGIRAPDKNDTIKVGEWNSLDIHYRHKNSEPLNLNVRLNGKSLHHDVKIARHTPYGIISPLSTVNAKDSSMYTVAISDSLKYNMGLKNFTVAARFKTKSKSGTLMARTSPLSGWEPDGKALFIQNGQLDYDIGWKGVIRSERKVNDNQWHYAVLTNDGDMCIMYLDGKVNFMKRKFHSPDRDNHVFKIGYDLKNFFKPFNGEISDVFYFDRALTEKETVMLMQTNKSPGKEILHWQPSQEVKPATSSPQEQGLLSGPIRLQGDFSKIRYANMWIKEL